MSISIEPQHEQLEQEAYTRFCRDRPTTLTAKERDAIWRLAQDVPSLWASAKATAKERQEIVRLLLDQITIDIQGDSEKVDVTLSWAGGSQSQHCIIRPVARYDQLSTYPKLLTRIDTLHDNGISCEKIAVHLNREGFHPPKRTNQFSGERVAGLLSRRGLHRSRPRAMIDESVLRPHEYWLTDLARKLAMPIATLHKWQRSSWVHSRKVAVAGGRWAIWADTEELERLRRLRAYKRKWPEPRYPESLNTPTARREEEYR